MEVTSNLAHHIFYVGIPFLPFSNAFSIHNSCGIKHYEQEQTDMQPLLFPISAKLFCIELQSENQHTLRWI